MEKNFKELLRLLQINPLNEILLFENGRLNYKHDLYEFKYQIRRFFELIYSIIVGINNSFTLDQINSIFKKLSQDLINTLRSEQELLRYVSRYG